MRKRESKLLKTLRLIEDLLILSSDYFDKDIRNFPDLEDWLYAGVKSTSNYFVQKGVLNPDLSFRKKPKSVLRLIENPWDGKWRFIVYDVPQEHKVIRNLIRRRLKEWDFKLFQKSIWFSPLPLTTEILKLDKQIDDTDYLSVIEGKIHRDNPRKLIKEKWAVDQWKNNALYWMEENRKISKMDAKNQEAFWTLISEHPKIPLELLPKNWPLKDIFETFTKRKFKI
jgi:DNA-binding transcriptional regulator PaaX